ncbi:tubulointerstitial nephritis antigen isoform X3 [Tympanuchus pallidicinctus]|uniref:tubulointerstitial nephritis antigen isoform X3 n=1 Tax=Tympanuchus pallidicinctus TaxID=109042 RepID=UPI0022873E91|nr:tubulointerstitial nephritis antigen isoform X3 [Tympanuchus pallidicinctus]
MWLKSQILLLYCIASEVWTAKRLDARRNLTKELYSLEDSGSAKWNRLKRSLYQGKSCRIRGCCTGRNDDCSFNIASRAAICYCDQFCASGPPGPIDCCADYWDTCENTVEPTRSDEPWPPSASGCYKDGRYYGEGAIIKDNCNSCKCIQSNWKCSNEVCLVRPDLIHRINSGDYGWKADNYTQFWGMTLEEGFRKRLGTLPPSHSLLNMKAIPGSSLLEEKFPEFFAATYAWPDWIHDPLDQRNCGASWAFSTASVAADRITIHSDGQITDNLSVQNLISCDTRNQHGCGGGNIESAWRYLKTHGVVSYACYPSFWKHHLDSPSENHCYVSSEYGKNHTNGPCPNALEDSNRLYRCGSHYRVSSKETDIMEEIMAKGPVQAIMKVYEDFFLYKEGIYRHSYKEGSKWKTHSVKLLGWGSLPGKNGQKQKFWIAANSWGKYWGENGYFRILRGQNECDIEKLILTTLG